MESRVRQLIMAVERISLGHLLAHTWHSSEFHESSEHSAFFIGIRKRPPPPPGTPAPPIPPPPPGHKFDLRAAVMDFKYKVGLYTATEEGMTVSVRHLKNDQVPLYAREVWQGAPQPATTPGLESAVTAPTPSKRMRLDGGWARDQVEPSTELSRPAVPECLASLCRTTKMQRRAPCRSESVRTLGGMFRPVPFLNQEQQKALQKAPLTFELF